MLQYAYRAGAPATRGADPAGADGGRWSEYAPLAGRPRIRWPGDARVALWISPNILHYEFTAVPDPWLGMWTRMPQPDVLAYGRQDYGNRVGFWRMLDALDRHGARCTACVNVEALERYPAIRDAAVERGWRWLGHGWNNSRFVYGMDPAAERDLYRRMQDRVESLTGVRMLGMGGPGPQSATGNTPDLLAELGFLYHADWFHDDQPFPLRVGSGRLMSLPYALETNDAPFLGAGFEAGQFAEAVRRQFDRLWVEGAEHPRVMCLALHPALLGQPQRIGHLEALLDHLFSRPGVWQATADEIALHWDTHWRGPVEGWLAARRDADAGSARPTETASAAGVGWRSGHANSAPPATDPGVATQAPVQPPAMVAGHELFDYRPIRAARSPEWPGGAKLAIALVVSIESYSMDEAADALFPASLPGGFGRGPWPDFRTWSHRQYGHRIGLFRVAAALARHRLPVTAALDAASARSRPELVGLCLEHGWEIAAHGESLTRLISSRLSEAEERDLVGTALETIERAAGCRPRGWHGAEHGESGQTPAILAGLGVHYLLDWPNDELPYLMRTRGGPLLSVPMSIDLDDVFAHWHRKLPMQDWVEAVSGAVDRMLEEGRKPSRMLALNLHPWLIGQPWRIGYLETLLAGLAARKGVWFATAGDIADHYRRAGPAGDSGDSGDPGDPGDPGDNVPA